MSDWTELDTSNLLVRDPWSSAKALAVFENPKALAEGATGAPAVAGVYELLEIQEPTADVQTVTFATDLSNYYSVRVDCITGSNVPSGNVHLQVGTADGSTWQTIATSAIGPSSSVRLSAEFHNANNQDATSLITIESKVGRATASLARGTGAFQELTVDERKQFFMTFSTSYTQMRVTSDDAGTLEGTDAVKRGVFRLYGATGLTRQATA